MMSVELKEAEIINEFEAYPDWLDKYDYLIELGKSLPQLEEQYKSDNNIINGCQSKVWIYGFFEGGKVVFKADSEAIITKGLVNLIIRVLSNETPDDILNAKLDFLDVIGLKEHLSPTRANGLLALIKQMKLYALAFKSMSNEQ